MAPPPQPATAPTLREIRASVGGAWIQAAAWEGPGADPNAVDPAWECSDAEGSQLLAIVEATDPDARRRALEAMREAFTGLDGPLDERLLLALDAARAAARLSGETEVDAAALGLSRSLEGCLAVVGTPSVWRVRGDQLLRLAPAPDLRAGGADALVLALHVSAGDRLVLCAKGIDGTVSDPETRRVLALPTARLIAQRLAKRARLAGGEDAGMLQVALISGPLAAVVESDGAGEEEEPLVEPSPPVASEAAPSPRGRRGPLWLPFAGGAATALAAATAFWLLLSHAQRTDLTPPSEPERVVAGQTDFEALSDAELESPEGTAEPPERLQEEVVVQIDRPALRAELPLPSEFELPTLERAEISGKASEVEGFGAALPPVSSPPPQAATPSIATAAAEPQAPAVSTPVPTPEPLGRSRPPASVRTSSAEPSPKRKVTPTVSSAPTVGESGGVSDLRPEPIPAVARPAASSELPSPAERDAGSRRSRTEERRTAPAESSAPSLQAQAEPRAPSSPAPPLATAPAEPEIASLPEPADEPEKEPSPGALAARPTDEPAIPAPPPTEDPEEAPSAPYATGPVSEIDLDAIPPPVTRPDPDPVTAPGPRAVETARRRAPLEGAGSERREEPPADPLRLAARAEPPPPLPEAAPAPLDADRDADTVAARPSADELVVEIGRSELQPESLEETAPLPEPVAAARPALEANVRRFLDAWSQAIVTADHDLYESLGFSEQRGRFHRRYRQRKDQQLRFDLLEVQQRADGRLQVRAVSHYHFSEKGQNKLIERREQLLLDDTPNGLRYVGDW